jgi:hypothetical protein
MLVDHANHVGWTPPTEKQKIRALLRAHPFEAAKLPAAKPTSDNSALCCTLDQLDLGACTANAWAQVLYMELRRENLGAFVPSRLANYFFNRHHDGNDLVDSGASIGGAFEVGADMGVAEEAVWPYLTERFRMRPPPDVDRNGYDRKGKVNTHYFPIHASGDNLIETIERVLTSRRGVAYGRLVTAAFCSTLPSGVIQPPVPDDVIAGGHAETIVGHNRAERWFLIKGSWGADFHEPGYPPGCYRLAYETVADGSDFWFCNLSTGGL